MAVDGDGSKGTLAAAAFVGFLVGGVGGFCLASRTPFALDTRVPVVDLASLVVSIATLVIIPVIFARFERKRSFDKRAVAERLEPAQHALLEIDDICRTFDSDLLSPDVLASLVTKVQRLRTGIERSKQIAHNWGWHRRFLDDLENAAGLAQRLNRFTTGLAPYSKQQNALQVSMELQAVLLSLLRRIA